MAKRVTEGHIVVDDDMGGSVAEALIQAQNAENLTGAGNDSPEGVLLAADCKEGGTPEEVDTHTQKEGTEDSLTLTRAASYIDHGQLFIRGIPATIRDERRAAALRATGLFQ